MDATVATEVPAVSHGHRQPCPECGGRGYTTIETRESVTLCGDRYPITYQIVGYKTVRCWRCKGTKRIESDSRAA